MLVFRKKYLYNSNNPIYQSDAVKTYNCLNSQTKNNQLILLHHLKGIPLVENNALQPVESPSVLQPFSVYPLVYCCSEIGRINESDVMYVIKCLVESKVKNPLYSVLSSQGICVSEVEGILPNPSPTIDSLARLLLGLNDDYEPTASCIVSREAVEICKLLKAKENADPLLQRYQWYNPKKDKEIKDNQFWIYRGKRKEDDVTAIEYSLAWNPKLGLARFKYIDFSKEGAEEEFINDFNGKMERIKGKKQGTIEIFKWVKQGKGIKIFLQSVNQGTLGEYIARRNQNGRPLSQGEVVSILDYFVTTMRELPHCGTFNFNNLYMNDHQLLIGEPVLVTDKIQKKIRDLRGVYQFLAPQLKENIILPELLFKLNFEKFDVWSLGMLLHKMLTQQFPLLDNNRVAQVQRNHMSQGMAIFIRKCLSIVPEERLRWIDIHLKDLQSTVVVEEIKEEVVEQEVIRLGTRHQKKKEQSSVQNVVQKIERQETIHIKQQNQFEPLKVQEQLLAPVPLELSSRLKKVKLIIKLILVMLLYIFVFFLPFLSGSVSILVVRSLYSKMQLNLVDSNNLVLSSTTLITDSPNFFLLNDISFAGIQQQYNCIDDQFNINNNSSYSLLSYIQSGSFFAFLLCGWVAFIAICVIKGVSLWRGGLSNRPRRSGFKYWAVYAFHQLSLASLLFSHFFIFQFFYFATGQPCLSLTSYNGLQPFFDSTLYLFLMNFSGYFQHVFASLGVLSILTFLSVCFYACSPKLDVQHFLSVPSLLLRIFPYILLFLICRIGVFFILSPTPLDDPTSILGSIIYTSQGLFGLVPEIFILICILLEAIVQALMNCCQRKAAESDQLSKLFSIRKKKIDFQDSRAILNDMSFVDVSRNQLNGQELFQ